MKKLIACLLMILMSVPALAAIIVSDPFDDGGRTDGADAQDAAWWKAYNDATLTLDVQNDGVLGNALHYASSSTSVARRGVANFTSTTLQNVGDKITVSLDFRLVSSPAKANGIRFGLFDAGTTLLTEDTTGSTATNAIVGTDKGYFAALGAGVAESTLYRDNGTSTLMGGTDLNTFLPKNTTLNISDLLKHTASLAVTKTAAGVSLEVFVDGVSILTNNDGSSSVLTFNEIVIGGGNALDIFYDNVNVEYTVPEPATLSILALGAFLSLRKRRG